MKKCEQCKKKVKNSEVEKVYWTGVEGTKYCCKECLSSEMTFLEEKLDDFSNRYDLFRGNKDMMMDFLTSTIKELVEKIPKFDTGNYGGSDTWWNGYLKAKIEDNKEIESFKKTIL
jgi:NAD-dependent SIR2 family protein deacetylase